MLHMHIRFDGLRGDGGFRTAASRYLRAFGFLLFPRGCAGCDMPDQLLCPSCLSGLSDVVARPMPRTAMAFCFASALYRGSTRAAILAWKDHGDLELGRVFGASMALLARRVVIPALRRRADVKTIRIAVVPVPSSRHSLRHRGRLHTLDLAGAVVRQLRSSGLDASLVNGLDIRGNAGKSVQVAGSRGRANRINGLVHVRSRLRLQAYSSVILVDDIITTASTLRECMRALSDEGLCTLTALLIASTAGHG